MDKRLMAIALLMLCREAAAEHARVQEDYFDDLPVVLSASRLVQSIDEAPAAVTVIDREMIRASGVRDIVDLFRLVPGMVVGMAKGHQPTLGFHGFADVYFRQLQILVDGVSIYSPMWGGAEWSDLPIAVDDVERIEVVRGPNAAAFGANSFLGVVNIITRDPAVDTGLGIVVNKGENGIGDVIARYGVNQGDLRYRLSAGQRADQGLDSYPDSRRSNFLNLRGHYRLAASDELRLQASYMGGVQGEGVYAVPNHSDGPRPRHTDAGSVQLRWTRVSGSDEEIWLQLSHAERRYRETVPYVLKLGALFGDWNFPIDQSYDHRRTDLELQHTLRPSDSLRAVWGAQSRSDGARSIPFFGSETWQTSSLFRLFGNAEWRPASRWILAAGAMYENNSITGNSVSPNVAVSHHFLPGQTVRLRAASARRTPTLFEDRVNWGYDLPDGLRARLAGMPAPYSGLAALRLEQSALARGNVGDETIRAREMSYMGHFPDYRLNVEYHLFQHRLDNLIGNYLYPYPTVFGFIRPAQYGSVWDHTNLDTATVRGQSATVRWQPRPGTLFHWAGSRTLINGSGAHQADIVPSAPLHTSSTLVAQDLPANWQVSLAYYRVGPMQVMGGGSRLPATEHVDLRLARRFQVGTSRGEIALIVKNATDAIPVFELGDIDRRTSWLNIRVEY